MLLAGFIVSLISPSNPSLRMAQTVIGTDAPTRMLMLDGTTRSSKSGRGGLMRRR